MPSLSDILYSLRYQILTPQVTTMGPCEVDGCGNSARGSSMCSGCRTKILGELLGDEEKAWNYAQCLVRARDALWDVEDMADELEEQTK